MVWERETPPLKSCLLYWYTMGGGGGRINKPKSARRKTKQKKQSVKSSKKSSSRDKDTIGNTTADMLRQCRTNPKANVTLSGKKKRLLVKEARRMLAGKVKMEVDKAATVDSTENGGQRDSDKMDTT